MQLPLIRNMVDFQKVDASLLDRMCSVAKLTLNTSEKKKFLAEMSEILEAFGTVEEAYVGDTPPAYHPTAVENIWRDDTIIKKSKLDIGKNTNAVEDGYVVGPKLV